MDSVVSETEISYIDEPGVEFTSEKERVATRRKQSRYTSEQHAHQERHRHRGLNNVLKDLSAKVPGFETVKAETKIIQLQRIINYICFLENRIDQLRTELKAPVDSRLISLTAQLKRISGGDLAASPFYLDLATGSAISSGKWRFGAAKKRMFLTGSHLTAAKISANAKAAKTRISSPTIDSTTGADELTFPFKSSMSDAELDELDTSEILSDDDSEAMTRSSFDDDTSSNSSCGPLPDMLDFVTDTDMDKNVFGLLLSPQQNGEDSNEQPYVMPNNLSSNGTCELEDIHSYAKMAPELDTIMMNFLDAKMCEGDQSIVSSSLCSDCANSQESERSESLYIIACQVLVLHKVYVCSVPKTRKTKRHSTHPLWSKFASDTQPQLTRLRMDARRGSWMNGFMMYSRHHRRSFIAKHPGMQTSYISKILGQTWNKMTREEQEPYREEARLYRLVSSEKSEIE